MLESVLATEGSTRRQACCDSGWSDSRGAEQKGLLNAVALVGAGKYRGKGTCAKRHPFCLQGRRRGECPQHEDVAQERHQALYCFLHFLTVPGEVLLSKS